ncbi:hypothetical protein KSP40_PGU000789 [Platanthera guangdongensis]|uniref:Uncharacterized protein n=1 Tax=Platanthera guangdongensis TaxID=2320717 RepID=A0ABR2MD00_9ASPA
METEQTPPEAHLFTRLSAAFAPNAKPNEAFISTRCDHYDSFDSPKYFFLYRIDRWRDDGLNARRSVAALRRSHFPRFCRLSSMLRTLSSPSPAGISIKFFGITNGQALNHSFIQMPLTVNHMNKFPINRKVAYPNLNHGGFICSSSPRSSSGDTSASSSDVNPSTFQSLKHFSGPSSSRRVDKDIDGNGIPVPSTFDFLELKRELEKEENFRTGSEKEELLSNLDKEGIVARSSRVRGGRQVMRRSNLLAKQVICIESARSLGFVSQLWVDTKLWVVALVEVRPSFLSGDTEKFLLEDVYQVGDVLLVSDEPLMENELKMTGLDTLNKERDSGPCWVHEVKQNWERRWGEGGMVVAGRRGFVL